MNIFVLDLDPSRAAQAHCDKHVVKMILETAQILCTCLAHHGVTVPYRPTHKNHPCVRWVSESSDNFAWTLELGIELAWEYNFRYGRCHRSGEVLNELLSIKHSLPCMGLTPRPLAMPEQYHSADPVEAYRAYYRTDKAHLLTYKKRPPPEWLVS